MKKKVLSLCLAVFLCAFTVLGTVNDYSFAATKTDANVPMVAVPKTATIAVDGGKAVFKVYTVQEQEIYSLRDMAKVLNGTSKQFSLQFDPVAKAVVVRRGQPYTPSATEPATLQGNQMCKIATTKLYTDGERMGFSVYSINGNSYMTLWDLMLMLNANVAYDGNLSCNAIDTTKGYTIDVNHYLSTGYFNDLHGAILGNATTGEIIYSYKADQKVAIASVSKIMTYLIIREAIDAGKITWNDQVNISSTAARYAASSSGTVPLKAGQKANLKDLVDVMLIVSSNESSTALAEHLCGSEAAFAAVMNQRAKELGLTGASFINPHGLPSPSDNSVQNTLTARDVFTLASYIIKKYPEVLEITNKSEIWSENLQFYGENTNGLIFKIPEVDGLKTGYTRRAGYCLSATMPVKVGEEEQRIVAVVLGGKDVTDRVERTRVLIHYGKQYYNN